MDELEKRAIASLQAAVNALAQLTTNTTGTDDYKKLTVSTDKVRLISENLKKNFEAKMYFTSYDDETEICGACGKVIIIS